MRDATLVVLAGGRGERMGTPKALLRVGDVTLVEWIVARLLPAFGEVLVCGATDAPARARALPDERPDAGPLGGIETGLAAASHDAVFVLACDTPRASAGLAALLIERSVGHDAAVPRIAGRTQPTCGAYRKRALAGLRAFLDAGGRRATRALETMDVAYVDAADLERKGIDVRELADLDTTADYDAFIASLEPR
jgi:molybdopterin-guanine dinucleotide biosynthesis protein A